MVERVLKLVAALILGSGALAGGAQAASSAPKSANGHAVQQVASGLNVTTAFAFGAGEVFAGSAGTENGSEPGGVFVLRNGRTRLLGDSPGAVFGLAWRDGTLYISSWKVVLAWSHWDGSDFADKRTIYQAPKSFSGFDGLGFAADGRLYAGVMDGVDHGPTHTPYARDIISMDTSGKAVRIVARGIRQPWQLAFALGSNSPFVSVLGQDSGAVNPPDFVLHVTPGQNYGFPTCNWIQLAVCRGFTRPFRFFTAHTDPMGLAVVGNRLYISEFGAVHPPQVVSMPLVGGPTTPVLTGFSSTIVGLGENDGWLYVGETNGHVFRVTL